MRRLKRGRAHISDDASLRQDENPGKVLERGRPVRDHDKRGQAEMVPKLPQDAHFRRWVKARSCLIENHYLWLLQKSSRQSQPLAFAT